MNEDEKLNAEVLAFMKAWDSMKIVPFKPHPLCAICGKPWSEHKLPGIGVRLRVGWRPALPEQFSLAE